MEIIKSKLVLYREKILAGLIFIFLIGFISAGLLYLTNFYRATGGGEQIIPRPSPVVQATPAVKRSLSSIATEAGFIKLEQDLQLLGNDLSTVDLSEPKISLPIIEMDVSFEK